jgi:hypothetical protein
VQNAAILIGSVSGPLLIGIADFPTVLILFGLMRVAAGSAILIFG